MAGPVMYQTQLQALESGLGNLKRSRLLVQPEVKTMYTAMKNHHTNVKLSNLTGQCKELLEQGRQDTKFYYLLMRMLVEVINSGDEEQKSHLRRVFRWYQNNSHIVKHSGPKFGRAKSTITSSRTTSVDNLEGSFKKLLKKISTPAEKKKTNAEFLDLDITDLSKESVPYLYPETELDESDTGAAVREVKRPHTVAAPGHRTPASERTPGSEPARPIDSLLPKRKIAPLSHLYNPHSKDPATGYVQAADSDLATLVHTPVTFKVKDTDEALSEAERVANRRKWEAYLQEHNYGQDTLSKLQHMGRSGVAGGIRYAAHHHGNNIEENTKEIILSLMQNEVGQKSGEYDADVRPVSRLANSRLEDFYELAEGYYPHRLPKYPSFQRSPRAKSAPSGGRRTSTKPRAPSAKSIGESEEPRSRPATRQDVSLDTVVSVIDNVTDEMTQHKEKLCADPQSGFRQPTFPIEISERPQTAPVGTMARPTSPEEHKQGGTMDAIDWRGKVTPETSRHPSTATEPQGDAVSMVTEVPGWSSTALGSHTYVQKIGRPKSSLRTAGSTHAGYRPRTAPTAARGHTTNSQTKSDGPDSSLGTVETDSQDMTDIIRVRHLGGTSRTRRSRHLLYHYSYLFDEHSRPHTVPTTSPAGTNMEFMSIAAPKSLSGGSRSSSPAKHHTEEELSEVHQYSEVVRDPSPQHTIPSGLLDYDQRSHDSSRSHDGSDSLSARDFEEPNLDDLQEDLDDIDEAEEEQDDIPEGNRVHFEDYEDGVHDNSNNQQLLDDIKELLGRTSLHAQEGDATLESDVLSRAQTAPQNTPHSHSHGNQRLAPSQYWSYEPEIESEEKTLAKLNNALKDTNLPYRSPRGHRTKTGRAFPKSECVAQENSAGTGSLSVQGMGTSGGRSRSHSAGHMRLGRSGTDRQIYASLLRHQEMLRRAPAKPQPSAPSIPSGFGQFGTRSPRRADTYSTELEMHAKKALHPQQYMKKVSELRKDTRPTVTDAPAERVSNEDEGRPLTASLTVHRITSRPAVSHQRISPYIYGNPGTPVNSVDYERMKSLGYTTEKESQDALSQGSESEHSDKPHPSKPRVESPSHTQKYLATGRPIADYLEHVEPDDYAVAMEIQKQAKAAADIQRLFRGYAARNRYKYLLIEEREKKENRRLAAVEIQRRYRGHLARKRAIRRRSPGADTVMWARDYRQQLVDREAARRDKAQAISTENAKNKALSIAKISTIGPHVAVYDSFHPKETGPDRQLMRLAATLIQAQVRGWLIRTKMLKLKRKAKQQCGSWDKFLVYYREFLYKIQMRLGIDRPQFFFSFDVLNNFMETKRRFETVFDKKSFGGEMEVSELSAFFKECDLYPSQGEVDNAYDLVFRGQPVKRGLHKSELLELVFQIYPPKGTGLLSDRCSTWMNPIVDGEEALKLIGTEGVEPTNFKACWNVVAESRRRRNEASRRQQEVDREREWQRKHGTGTASGQGQDTDMTGDSQSATSESPGTELQATESPHSEREAGAQSQAPEGNNETVDMADNKTNDNKE